jgi:hypothetical protein
MCLSIVRLAEENTKALESTRYSLPIFSPFFCKDQQYIGGFDRQPYKKRLDSMVLVVSTHAQPPAIFSIHRRTNAMNFLLWTFLLLVPLVQCYPRHYSTDLNDFLNLYWKQREQTHENSIFQQPTCLPAMWTCGPNLPPCCAGLTCYDGNAKRGRHCVARG